MYDNNPWNAVMLVQSLQMMDRGREQREGECVSAPRRGIRAGARRAIASLRSIFGRHVPTVDAGAACEAAPQPFAGAPAADAVPVRKRQPGRRPAKPLVSADEYRAVSSRDAAAHDAGHGRVSRE